MPLACIATLFFLLGTAFCPTRGADEPTPPRANRHPGDIHRVGRDILQVDSVESKITSNKGSSSDGLAQNEASSTNGQALGDSTTFQFAANGDKITSSDIVFSSQPQGNPQFLPADAADVSMQQHSAGQTHSGHGHGDREQAGHEQAVEGEEWTKYDRDQAQNSGSKETSNAGSTIQKDQKELGASYKKNANFENINFGKSDNFREQENDQEKAETHQGDAPKDNNFDQYRILAVVSTYKDDIGWVLAEDHGGHNWRWRLPTELYQVSDISHECKPIFPGYLPHYETTPAPTWPDWAVSWVLDKCALQREGITPGSVLDSQNMAAIDAGLIGPPNRNVLTEEGIHEHWGQVPFLNLS